MKKINKIPELNTFTILNPNFELPKENNPVLVKQEKQLFEGNVSENPQNEV